jgi:hypothetical protein
MVKRMSIAGSIVVFMAVITLMAAGCGGGGGGGSSHNTKTGTTVKIKGTTNSTGKVAGGQVERDAVTFAGDSIVAYEIGKPTVQLNSASDVVDGNGRFEVTLDFGKAVAKDVVIKIVDQGENIKLAFDGLDPSETDNITGKLIDYASTRKADMFELVPDQALSVISEIDDIFATQSIDINATLITDDSASSADSVSALIGVMDGVLDACSSTDYSCMYTEIQTALADTASDAPAAVQDLLQEAGTAFEENTIDAIAADAGVSLTSIDTTAEEESLHDLMSGLVTAWDSGGTTLQKRLAVKEAALKVVFGDVRTSSDVPADVTNILTSIRSHLASEIGSEAVTESGATLVSGTDLGSVVAGYDIVRGMLIEEMVSAGGASSADAAAAVESLLKVAAQLGANSDAGSMSGVVDDWVVEWADAALIANLMTALEPFNMDVRAKTDIIMPLINDLMDKRPANDDAIEDILNDYLSDAATASAMGLYHQYLGCKTDGTAMTSCFTADDIISFLEVHYGYALPELRAVVTGVQEWYTDTSRNGILLIAVGNAYNIVYNRDNSLLKLMAESDYNNTQLSNVLDSAGVKPELFWLYNNLSPYFTN